MSDQVIPNPSSDDKSGDPAVRSAGGSKRLRVLRVLPPLTTAFPQASEAMPPEIVDRIRRPCGDGVAGDREDSVELGVEARGQQRSGRAADDAFVGELVKAIESGACDMLVISRSSDVTRSRKRLRQLLDAVARHEVRFISMEDDIDTADADGAEKLSIWAAALAIDFVRRARTRRTRRPDAGRSAV